MDVEDALLSLGFGRTRRFGPAVVVRDSDSGDWTVIVGGTSKNFSNASFAAEFVGAFLDVE